MTICHPQAQHSNISSFNTIFNYIDAKHIHPTAERLVGLMQRKVTVHRKLNENELPDIKGAANVYQNLQNLPRITAAIESLSIQHSDDSTLLTINTDKFREITAFTFSNQLTHSQIQELSIETTESAEKKKSDSNTLPFATTAVSLALQYLRNVFTCNSTKSLTNLLAFKVQALHIQDGKEIDDKAGIDEVTRLFRNTFRKAREFNIDKITITTTQDSAEIECILLDSSNNPLTQKISLFISREENKKKIGNIILNTRTEELM